MVVIFTAQAKILMKSLKNFDLNKFIEWYKKENLYITYSDFLEFIVIMNSDKRLEFIKNIANVSIFKGLKFSPELEVFINDTDIDIDLLKKFYSKKSELIGDGSIFYYLNRSRKKR